MKRTLFHVLSGVAISAALAPTSVWAHKGSINQIERREQVRINQGVRSGELTRSETKRMEAEQAKIRVDERFDRADGRLTVKEREQLNKELRRASRDIYRQKHDNQQRDR